MAYELVVKEPFAAHDKASAERQRFNRGDIITDPDAITKIEKSPWAHHVMRRAIPAPAPQPEKPTPATAAAAGHPAEPVAASEE